MPLPDFRRTAALVESALRAGPLTFTAEAESPTALQVERGLPYAATVLAGESLPDTGATGLLLDLGLGGPDRIRPYAVVDRTGHRRPVYRGLLAYAALQTFRLAYERIPPAEFGRWEEGLRAWADLLEADLTAAPRPAAPPVPPDPAALPAAALPAARGADVAGDAWSALALHAAGKVFVRDAWVDLASDTFGRLARAQHPSGPFLTASASDNPETHWYHELTILHAAAAYAVQAEDRPLSAAVLRNARFHLAETQPDHATHQPWALFAFAWHPDTHPLADQVLHAATALPGATAPASPSPAPLTSILLADALYCLRLFLD